MDVKSYDLPHESTFYENETGNGRIELLQFLGWHYTTSYRENLAIMADARQYGSVVFRLDGPGPGLQLEVREKWWRLSEVEPSGG